MVKRWARPALHGLWAALLGGMLYDAGFEQWAAIGMALCATVVLIWVTR